MQWTIGKLFQMTETKLILKPELILDNAKREPDFLGPSRRWTAARTAWVPTRTNSWGEKKTKNESIY